MNKEVLTKPKNCDNIGGSALIEGVMMRGKDRMAVSVRKSSGEIYTEVKECVPWTKKNKFTGLPFVRGTVSLFESMVTGIKTLMDSAELVDIEEEETESKFEKWLQEKLGDNYMTFFLYGSVIIAFAFMIGIFMLLPNLIADFSTNLMGYDTSTGRGGFLANVIEGLVRIIIFVGYIILVSLNKDIKRVFQYHGAEHKTIHAYENGEELTVENAKKYTTLHPRCGTTFMFLVVMISIIVHALTGWHNRLLNIVIRLALVPVIAGISYEVLKFAAKTNSRLVKALSMPGLMLQKITTKEPDDSMLEVAIASLKAVVEEPAESPAEVPSENLADAAEEEQAVNSAESVSQEPVKNPVENLQ
ncbi:MAG: DUF1385 domain-containing protein [Clostridiaceae bacterium]|nr:DUF1385 domain-containing protein [Clostridiaceae bacterium]